MKTLIKILNSVFTSQRKENVQCKYNVEAARFTMLMTAP
jgi:hypothetical protein